MKFGNTKKYLTEAMSPEVKEVKKGITDLFKKKYGVKVKSSITNPNKANPYIRFMNAKGFSEGLPEELKKDVFTFVYPDQAKKVTDWSKLNYGNFSSGDIALMMDAWKAFLNKNK